MLATFALGTAVGDLTGLTLHLGFLDAGLLFLVAIVVPLVAWRLGANAVAVFWTAYVLTRPLGASFADWLGKAHRIGGGRGYGDGTVTVVAIMLIVAAVACGTKRSVPFQRVDQEVPAPAAELLDN